MCERPGAWWAYVERAAQVLVAAGEGLLVVDADAAHAAAAAVGRIQGMAVAPGGQFVAVFTADGRLVVLTADFANNLSEFATQSDAPPEQLAWCGADSVVLVWEVRAPACRSLSLAEASDQGLWGRLTAAALGRTSC